MTDSRWYRIAAIDLQIMSDLAFRNTTFSDKLELFRIDSPADDVATIHHHFALPDPAEGVSGELKYDKPPWSVYRTAEGWTYLGIVPDKLRDRLWKIALFNEDHSYGHIFHKGPDSFLHGGNTSLTLFPSDQIWIAQLLAERRGCYLHSAGVVADGAGLLFVGHSEAGKSTTTQMLIDAGARGEMNVEVLCDDRNIVRKYEDDWHVFGSWSHGDIPLVSPSSAPLRAICFLEQADENRLLRLNDRREVARRLLRIPVKLATYSV